MRFYDSLSLLQSSRRNSFLFNQRLLLTSLGIIAALHSSYLDAQQIVEGIPNEKSGENYNSVDPKCVWVAAWAGDSANEGNNKSYLKYLQKNFDYEDKKSVPGCFGRKWADLCLGRDGKGGVSSEAKGSIQRYGWCNVPSQGGKKGSGSLLAKTLAEFLGAPSGKPGVSGNWFMDSECRYRENITGAKLCGFAGVAVSPLSLVFDEGSALDADMTVVDFSIDLNKPGSFSLWKGSDKAPLLVYDPDRSGNVATAARLFGNYTFGGRTSDLSQIKLDSRIDRPVWGNGYEALGLLDSDHDGRIAGAELEPLSLWFDKNRNAQSEAGEVKSLKSVGITALYYQHPAGQLGTDDIGLDIGYERIVNGRIVQGRSVDWYAESFSSKTEAMQALAAIVTSNSSRARLALDRDWRSDPLSFSPRAPKNHAANLSGYWRWRLVEDTNASNPGAFVFDQADDNSVRGFNVIETVLQHNEHDLHSGLAMLPAEGKLEIDSEGRQALTLTVADRNNGITAETKAVLEDGGFVLRGTTVQKFGSSNEPNAKSATLTYEWVAQKFVADPGVSRN
jgi:hypothetical protein